MTDVSVTRGHLSRTSSRTRKRKWWSTVPQIWSAECPANDPSATNEFAVSIYSFTILPPVRQLSLRSDEDVATDVFIHSGGKIEHRVTAS